MSTRRWSALPVVLLVLAPALAACGETGNADVGPGSGPSAGSDPSSSTGSSPSASASPSAASTTVARSGLEDQAPVKAARRWAAAVATEVNQRSTSNAPTRSLTTKRGARTLPSTYRSDYGLRYPGPLPFTPLSVEASGRTARVPACIQAQGWAVNGQGISPQDTVLTASIFVLKKVRGSWKLDKITGRQASCAGVTVKGYSQ